MNTVYTSDYLANECNTVDNNDNVINLEELISDKISLSQQEHYFKASQIDQTELQKLAIKEQLKIKDKKTGKIIVSY